MEHEPKAFTFAVVFLGAISTIAVALRLLARRRTTVPIGADDLWVIGSLIPEYGMVISGTFSELQS